MNAFVEAIWINFVLLYYFLEGIILFFIPRSLRYKNVKGQIVLITGAGSGLGRIMSHRFAKLGCTVVLWDVNATWNEETASQVAEYGSPVHAYTCDLSQREQIYSVAAKVKKDVGDVDILINNAGVVTGRNLLDCPDTMVQRTMDVNVMAHFWTVKSFLPSMLQRNKGHVVSIASGAGFIGMNQLVDYCASKFAAVGFMDSLRVELRTQNKTGVKTTTVCPYYINTGMFAGAQSRFPRLYPFLEPEYVVDKIMDAVLTNQQLIGIPRDTYISFHLKTLLPVKSFDRLMSFLGLDNSMEHFQGRKKTE